MADARAGQGVAGGKLILCGEHAVVHGFPAIALGVDRATRVTVREVSGRLRLRDAHGEAVFDSRLEEAVRTLLSDGWEVRIASDLPIGRGMGSSAALAVALVRAVAAARGEDLDARAVDDRAMAIERVFHGNPSGIDHAVAARGGVIRFRRGAQGAELSPLPTPSWSLAVLDSGTAGDTKRLVAGVAARRPAIDPHLEAIGEIVADVERYLDDVDALGPLLLENHRLLRSIGVSDESLDHLVEIAVGAGATGAKLAGAGGGGVVIALAHEPERVVAAARAKGIAAFVCRPARPA